VIGDLAPSEDQCQAESAVDRGVTLALLWLFSAIAVDRDDVRLFARGNRKLRMNDATCEAERG
jgi:hypothetical protein